jgi:hypothetical protein
LWLLLLGSFISVHPAQELVYLSEYCYWMYRFKMTSSVIVVIWNFVKTHPVAFELKQRGLTPKRTILIYVVLFRIRILKCLYCSLLLPYLIAVDINFLMFAYIFITIRFVEVKVLYLWSLCFESYNFYEHWAAFCIMDKLNLSTI